MDSISAPANSAATESLAQAASANSAVMSTSQQEQLQCIGTNNAATNVICDGQAGQYYYHIKWIKFGSSRAMTPVVTQNENGPCPLIAIVNVLLLRGKAHLPLGTDVVTSEQLMELLGDIVLAAGAKGMAVEDRLNFEQNMQDGIAIFPKLQTGLDVNVKFNGVQDFEYTPECIVFDLLGVALYHGWLVDPQQPEVAAATAGLGYNQLIEKIIRQKGASEERLAMEALHAEHFLERTASQLTYHGLSELFACLRDEELCVFFRNNHFSTLYKHQAHLYLLVTDQGFLRESDIVWETLDNVEGDSHFVDAELQPAHRTAAFHDNAKSKNLPTTDKNSVAPLSTESQVDSDFLVALSLQQEQAGGSEDEAGAVVGEGRHVDQLTDLELAKLLQEEEDRAAASAVGSAMPGDEREGSRPASRPAKVASQPGASAAAGHRSALAPPRSPPKEKKSSDCHLL